MNRKEHWEKVYAGKQPNEASWFQPTPRISLDFINDLHLPRNATIIDVGGGDSLLVDHLLDLGYSDITVLDISETAILKAKKRLTKKANRVNWVVSDITSYTPERRFDCWHDRATFHFLTADEEIQRYIGVAVKTLKSSGKMIIGTFDECGPGKCSGLIARNYNEEALGSLFSQAFRKIKCEHTQHVTPFGGVQDFLFCSFEKNN